MNEEFQSNNDEAVTTNTKTVQTEAPRRIFKTGSSLIAESPEMRSLGEKEFSRTNTKFHPRTILKNYPFRSYRIA